MLHKPVKPGAALQIGAGAAQLVAPLSGADPDGAVGRPSAISASCAAGVGGHPVQARSIAAQSMASPPGMKGDQEGIWQSVICLRVWAALSATAPLPRGRNCRVGCRRRAAIGLENSITEIAIKREN